MIQCITSLKELFHACNFTGHSDCSTCSGRMCATCTQGLSTLGDDILRDRIVTGVLSEEARHKLLATKDLPLKVCVDLCRAEDAADHTGSCLPKASQEHNGSFVNAVKPIDPPEARGGGGGGGALFACNNQRQRTQPQRTSPDASMKKCSNCGRSAHQKEPRSGSGSQGLCLTPDRSCFFHVSFFCLEDDRCAKI